MGKILNSIIWETKVKNKEYRKQFVFQSDKFMFFAIYLLRIIILIMRII